MKCCIKCGSEKPLSEYYVHPRMADGHLNKCKVCCREAARQQMQRILASPEWRERDLDRHREKARRYREAGRAIDTPAAKKARDAWRLRNKHKISAQAKVRNAILSGKLLRLPCVVCGSPDSQGHHEDYSKPLDVVWYCAKHHGERHTELQRQARASQYETAQAT